MKKKTLLVKIGLVSGLNYGSEGCREGFWRLAFQIFKRESVNYIVLLGGLVDSKALLAELQILKADVPPDERQEVTSSFVARVGNYLAENIPKIFGTKFGASRSA